MGGAKGLEPGMALEKGIQAGVGVGRGGRKSDLVAMSSSSPPQPQYSLGKPFIFRYWSGVSAETPPKYWGYGRLGKERVPQVFWGGIPTPRSPWLSFQWMVNFPTSQHPLVPSTCIQTCSWQQQHAGVLGGHTRTDCDRSQAGGPRRAKTGSPTPHHAGPPAHQRLAA